MKRFHVHLHVDDLARSEKHWVTDPQGIAWEHFHTMGNIPLFSEEQPKAEAAPSDSACCAPRPVRGKPVNVAIKPSSSCC